MTNELDNRLIGYSRYGAPIYVGAGGAPIEMQVDDNDDDDDTGDDLFDDGDGRDDDEEDDDLGRSTRRIINRNTRRPANRDDRRPRRDRRDDRNDPDSDLEPEDDTDEDDHEDDGRNDWQPPSRQQFEKMEAALAKANREAARRRTVGKAMDRFGIDGPEAFNDFLLSRGIDPESGNRLVGDDEDPDEQFGEPDEKGQRRGRTREEVARDLKRAEQRGRAAAEEAWKPGVALFAADAALRAAGFQGNDRMLTRALRLIDPDTFDIYLHEESGWPMVSGVDEQVKALQEDYPEWFRQPRGDTRDRRPAPRDRYRDDRDDRDDDEYERPARRRPSGGARQVDGGERRRAAAPRPRTWLQQLDDRITGKDRGGR